MNRLIELLPYWLRSPWATRAAVLLGLLSFPLVVPEGAVSIGFVALQYVLFALGLNIVAGWTGLLDLGAAGFVAVGAYTTAILTTQFGWPPLSVLPVAILAGGIAGIILGVPTLRHRADYFAILTLGFAELVALTIRNWPSVTRGSYGYSGIPPYQLPFLEEPLRAVPPIGFYYLAVALVVPSYIFAVWVRSTKIGRYFHLVKHSEVVGQTCGINILAVKLVAFGLSASLLAAGGYLWAVYQRSIVWTEFGVLLSFILLAPLVVGGIGNPNGVVFGAILIGSSLELIRRFLTVTGFPQNARYLIFACVLIACVHLYRSGMIPDRPSWFHRARRTPNDKAHSSTVNPLGAVIAPRGQASAVVLEVIDVAKSFDGVVALDGVTFQVMERECVALIGTNGSGKTTLLNSISGLIPPQRGIIRLRGRRIDGLPSFRIARLGVGRSFQNLSVFDDVDVSDNVYIAAPNASIDDVEQSLARFGLINGARVCASLSYGEKKALDLARVVVRPDTLDLLLLDEPTAGLSQREANDVVRALEVLRAQHALTVIVVSHDVMFLEALDVSRLIVLHQGRIFKEGRFADVRADAGVRGLFWGEGVVPV